ncbi:MAG: O-antigen ligase family protein [Thermoanaerobacteraceae bacterium]|nr:O-antigen ligase family protein [Thermoanaerobacteraceae bacterium]
MITPEASGGGIRVGTRSGENRVIKLPTGKRRKQKLKEAGRTVAPNSKPASPGLEAGRRARTRGWVEEEGARGLFWAALAGLLLLLFYPPFFRGLFFPVEQRWSLILATLLFVLTWFWKFSRRDLTFLRHPLEYAAFGLVLVYVASGVFYPASRGLALAEISKVVLYFFVFWMIVQLGTGPGPRSLILHSLYSSGLGVALAGLLTATEVIFIKDGFLGGRFYSTLQYPNALAAYMMGNLFLGFYLWGRADNRLRLAYAVGNYLLLVVFLGTGSRGAFLVLPVVLALYFLLAPAGWRLSTFAHLLATGLAALVANYRFIPLALAKDYAGSWTWFFLGLGAALALQVILAVAGKIVPSARMRAAVAAALIILALGGGYAYTSLKAGEAVGAAEPALGWERILPAPIARRIQDINLETRSSRERVEWTRDALSMLRERPLLGYGGGGWEAAYRQYQRYAYHSTQVHNYYAQLAVETGVVGVIVLATLWVSFFLSVYGLYRRSSGRDRLLTVSLLAAALSLGLHAALDFDLALGAVSILLWSCWGLSRSLERGGDVQGVPQRAADPEWASRQIKYAAAVVITALVIVLFSGSFLAGNASAREGVAALRQGNISLATAKLKEAHGYDPFTASYVADLAALYLRQDRPSEAEKVISEALSYEPYNYLLKVRLGEVYWAQGKIPEAVAALEEARDMAPWMAATWESLAKIYVTSGMRYLQYNQPAEARELFAAAAGLKAEVEGRLASLGDLRELHLVERGGLTLTPALLLEVAKAQYFLSRWEEAAANLEVVLKDKDLGSEARVWQALLADRQGEKGRAKEILRELEQKDPALRERFNQLKSLAPLS